MRAGQVIMAQLVALLALAAALSPPAGAGTARAGAAQSERLPPQVTIQRTWRGRVYADAKGRSLYIHWDDAPGDNSCIDGCIPDWPALIAPRGAKPVGDWTPSPRPGGVTQWTYKGRLVFTFHGDHKPGDVGGDAREQRTWLVVHYTPAMPQMVTPPAVSLQLEGDDYALADSSGMTLYQMGGGSAGASACDRACLQVWRPLEAAALAHRVGAWTEVPRPDGTWQWAYNGRPLYTYDGDGKPGAAEGEGVDGRWQVARP